MTSCGASSTAAFAPATSVGRRPPVVSSTPSSPSCPDDLPPTGSELSAMTLATTDLSDKHPEAQVCEPLFQNYGGRTAFSGVIATLKVFEDNSLVRAAVEQPGEGRVLGVDGGGSLRCALLGGNLAAEAASNGWAGVVVNGAVRDVDEIDAQPIGVRALAAFPRRSHKACTPVRPGCRSSSAVWSSARASGSAPTATGSSSCRSSPPKDGGGRGPAAGCGRR